ncbi:MAG: N-acetylmuramoyl-L-alanine amidase [Bacillota bacterium]
MHIEDMLLSNINRPRRGIVPRALVIHWTANAAKGADAIANAKYFNRGYKQSGGKYLELNGRPFNYASAHYIIDDRRIVRCIPEDEMAYHVGARRYKPDALKLLGSYPNATTLGIEMCVNKDGDFGRVYATTVKFSADILKRHGWTTASLWRHYDVTGKLCPGYFTDDRTAKLYGFSSAAAGWEKFRNDVKEELSSMVGRAVEGYVEVVVNGRKLGDKAIIIAKRSYVPVRAVAEALGLKVGWDGRVLLSTKSAVEKEVPVVFNGRLLDKEAVIVEGKAYFSTRELAYLLGLEAGWDGRVLLSTK